MLLDVFLVIVAVAMSFATFLHAVTIVRRERALRKLHKAIAEAGERKVVG